MCNPEKHAALAWPDKRLKKAGPFRSGAKAFREMKRLVERRGPIPPELWGADPRRRDVARRVSAIIKDAIAWSADYFVPEDPVDILLWGGWYDMAEIDAVMRIEGKFCVDFPKHEIETIFEGNCTLGQLVNYILENALCLSPWPLAGDESLESRVCPKAAAFADLRAFVERHGQMQGARLRPSADLRAAVAAGNWQRLDGFVHARFGVGGLVRRRFLGVLPPGWTWLAASGVSAVLLGKLLHWQLSAWLVLCALAMFLLGVLVARLSVPVWRIASTTGRDVVEWILRERSRSRAQEGGTRAEFLARNGKVRGDSQNGLYATT